MFPLRLVPALSIAVLMLAPASGADVPMVLLGVDTFEVDTLALGAWVSVGCSQVAGGELTIASGAACPTSGIERSLVVGPDGVMVEAMVRMNEQSSLAVALRGSPVQAHGPAIFGAWFGGDRLYAYYDYLGLYRNAELVTTGLDLDQWYVVRIVLADTQASVAVLLPGQGAPLAERFVQGNVLKPAGVEHLEAYVGYNAYPNPEVGGDTSIDYFVVLPASASAAWAALSPSVQGSLS